MAQQVNPVSIREAVGAVRQEIPMHIRVTDAPTASTMRRNFVSYRKKSQQQLGDAGLDYESIKI
jgi:hypothetical protein